MTHAQVGQVVKTEDCVRIGVKKTVAAIVVVCGGSVVVVIVVVA